jgi:hypothetical protein
MQLVTLKTLRQVKAVTKELHNYIEFCKKKSHEKAIEIEIKFATFRFLCLQIGSITGCLLRTLAGRRMDSSSGRMARQWTHTLGTVDNQMMQKKAERRASI